MTPALIIGIISVVLGGGGLAALLKSRSDNRKIQAETADLTAKTKALAEKTPAEIESISVATMRTSLESSQSQVLQLQREAAERDARHDRERQEWLTERGTMRAEFDAMEAKLRAALDELLALKERHNMAEPA